MIGPLTNTTYTLSQVLRNPSQANGSVCANTRLVIIGSSRQKLE